MMIKKGLEQYKKSWCTFTFTSKTKFVKQKRKRGNGESKNGLQGEDGVP
jgi:hypothetical protein